MKKLFLLFLAAITSISSQAQNPGDTIVVKGFKYGSASRDSMITFPPSNLTFEKIIMKYNMRCKNGLISDQSFPNKGCGEWDYSCNTYIVDSSRIETALNTTPSHLISNFTGTTFIYNTAPLFDFYNFQQTDVVLNSISSETQYTLGAGSSTITNFLKADERSGHSQLLFTASELLTAGFTAGNIDGLLLDVANVGGGLNFFKVGVKHSTVTALNNSTVSVTSFTNVFNSNKSFTVGANRVQFHTSFVWDGTSNVLFDFSFTNTVPSNPIIFNAASTASVMTLNAKNNYALDLAALTHLTINTSMMSSISNEITVAFWVYGRSSMLPANTSFIYGWGTDPNQRNLNLHLPWSDSNIYFDCGYSAGNYDRINKAAVTNEIGGQWNHWAFTKNATTGNMKIYLNGVLWHNGTGKTKPMSILNLILGKDKDLQNNYKGKVNELSIWDKELAIGDIQTWMNKPLDNTHPFYTNLLGYYRMAEGTGAIANDSKFNQISNGVNMQWTYDRGDKLVRSFFESTMRPNVTLVRGVYSITTNTIIVKDSVERNPNIVQAFTVVSNNTVVPMMDDAINVISTQSLYASDPINTYNGDTGTLTGTTVAASNGTINITNYNYYKRYPWFNEIMSFVTPYGKGLDMGIKGKTWFYDVSDFAPLMKGKKRLVMALGGQYQEQMDIDFWFVVGTPPRNVISFNQLWQGAGRAGDASAASINSDVRYNTQSVATASNGAAFKLRSTITGHGSQGEFSQNGGNMLHFFNVDGGADEFTWGLTIDCTSNPIMAQGGTWVYNRQGWCPGLASLMKEYDLTPYITAGNTHTLDYNCSAPIVGNGDYRYICAHQLVTYSVANRSLDANMVEVKTPSQKVFYSKMNPICEGPLIMVQNTGSTNITNMDIDYWVNNAGVKQSYNYTCNLNFMDTASLRLPIAGVWQNGFLPSGNIFRAEIKKVNGVADDYAYNNKYNSAFDVPAVVPSTFVIQFKTNNNPTENAYTLRDELGNIVGSSSFTGAPNTVYNDQYVLNGCYRLTVTDAGGDGLQWWANPGQGNGYVALKDGFGSNIKNFNSDFGSGFEFAFTTDGPLKIHENTFGSLLNIYPNPAHSKFFIEGEELEGSNVVLNDVLGHVIKEIDVKDKNKLEVNLNDLSAGIYFCVISKNGNKMTRKIVVN
jgi:hypothetical protein